MAIVLGLVVVLGGLLTINYFRTIPPVHASGGLPVIRQVPGSAPSLPWPSAGSAAVGVSGLGEIGSLHEDSAYPMASTAKIMTGLLVLEDHPLAVGQQGPVLTISDQDQQDLNAKAAEGQSVLPVTSGEQLTEFQLLQGLLIPSGNNIADLLARWDAGSVAAFVAKMNKRAQELGMRHTHFEDTSGFVPQTVSTAHDLLMAAPVAFRIPTFAQVVGMQQAKLPVAGTVYNVDYTLGRDGIVGIKTGSSPQAGACFVFAANNLVSGRPVTIFGAVMYQQSLDAAFDRTRRLIEAVAPALQLIRIVSAGQTVGHYQAPWGVDAAGVATKEVTLVGWPGTTIRINTSLRDVQAPLPAGSQVGTVTVGDATLAQQVPVVTNSPLFEPGRRWRFTRTDFLGGA